MKTRFDYMVEKQGNETALIMERLDGCKRPFEEYLKLATDYYMTIWAVRVMQGEAVDCAAETPQEEYVATTTLVQDNVE